MFLYCVQRIFVASLILAVYKSNASGFLTKKYIECGPYGFVCEGTSKLRLCEGENLFGPAFNCPSNTICNEDSSNVCDNVINYIDPALRQRLRCHRNERIADPSVPDCKGYVMCILNKNRFQSIKFKCAGNTVFNGFTRTCSSPDRYKCPLNDASTSTPKLFHGQNDRMDVNRHSGGHRISIPGNRPIDCKSYKFSVTQDKSPVRAAYFCPSRPVSGESTIRCTVFSNQFCITLERDDQDQFENSGAAYRKPRENKKRMSVDV